ncbi:TMEM175 family protein [Mesorhizobium sp. M0239]
MGKGRVEAFTDGVVAIIITIMVLELKVPHGEDFSALVPLWPIFFCYVLSFINVGIYWNNLHNMFHAVQRVDGRVLWANLNLLFWLSLMPVTTAFMGENHFAPVPVAVYGTDLALCAIAYTILAAALHRLHGN